MLGEEGLDALPGVGGGGRLGSDVGDPEQYRAYGEATRPIVARHGGSFVVRGGRSETVAGVARSRIIVIEFPDYEAALRCYHSPEYREATRLREAASAGEFVIVEGWDGPHS